MADVNNNDRCNSCRFYKSANNFGGQCHRYPAYQVKAPADWCGEWQSVKSAALEMMVEQTIKPIEIRFEEPKKQRGRPKKS